METCAEEITYVWKKDVKRLVQDTVGDAIGAWCLVRGRSARYPLYLLSVTFGHSIGRGGIEIPFEIREVGLEKGREEGLVEHSRFFLPTGGLVLYSVLQMLAC